LNWEVGLDMISAPLQIGATIRSPGAVPALKDGLVRYTGLLLMIIAAATAGSRNAHAESDPLLTDFTSRSYDLDWYVVNDNVMGGRSTGGFDIADGKLVFTGRTNTNGGGFSSIRTGPLQADLAGYNGIRLRVKGDGRRYTWRLSTDARWRGRQVGYWADLDTRDGEWVDLDIPWSAFRPQVWGNPLSGPDLDIRSITGMGLMIYDKNDGPFALQLDSVSVFAEPEPFTISQYRWDRRVLIVSAASADDANLKRQLEAVSMTEVEFADRDLTIVTLLDDGTSMAGDRALSADEVAEARSAMRISADTFALKLVGKDGSVKLSRDEATSMQDIYALIDTMPMRAREQVSRL
jgi:NADH dehydrogenase [ubiquinone] 1 alpha subcomplex assembly factor 1